MAERHSEQWNKDVYHSDCLIWFTSCYFVMFLHTQVVLQVIFLHDNHRERNPSHGFLSTPESPLRPSSALQSQPDIIIPSLTLHLNPSQTTSST